MELACEVTLLTYIHNDFLLDLLNIGIASILTDFCLLHGQCLLQADV